MLNTSKQPKPPRMNDHEPFDIFLVLIFCVLSACTVWYYADTIDCWNNYTDDCLEPMKGE